MTFQQYLDYFETIVETPNEAQVSPYDNLDYIEYVRMNWTRMNRWIKTGKLSEDLVRTVQNINHPQTWIVITEPWCGDAAHSVPFIHLLGELNPLITVEYELRDAEPFRINEYLTNGSKSIPVVIFGDNAVWGPRPKGCQEVYLKLVSQNTDIDTIKAEIQKWYNADKGREICAEVTRLLNK